MLADKRPEHGIDGLFTPLVALKFLECFAIAKGHDHTKIERLFQAGPRDRQRTAQAHVIYAADTAECAQGSQKKILIVNIPRSFQPKQHHVRDLAGAGPGSGCARRRERECDAAQKYRDGHAEDEQEVHLPDQSLKTTHPASKLNRSFETLRRKKFPYEGKLGAVQPIFFSQEIFVRRSKIKFRIFLVGFLLRF
jgi:hypothetical protein